MILTPAQKATVLADIQGNPTLLALYTDSVFTEIANYYNVVADPAYIVWRSKVYQDEITQNGFTWTEVDNLTVGKARIWEWLFQNTDKSFNPSKANVRAGIIEVWSGTAGRLAVQANVLGHCKRSATRIEKLLATGSGTDVSPSLMAVEGEISYQDIQGLNS